MLSEIRPHHPVVKRVILIDKAIREIECLFLIISILYNNAHYHGKQNDRFIRIVLRTEFGNPYPG